VSRTPERSARVLMVGCGDLGARIARHLITAGGTLYTLTRTPVLQLPVYSLIGDVSQISSLPRLPEALSELVYCLTPAVRDEVHYRRAYPEGLRNVLARFGSSPAPRVTFISSTAVYGEMGGGWVDEFSRCAPDAWNGRVLLEAEGIALDAHPGSIVLRLGGIYGPGRDSLVRNVQAVRPISAAALEWGNRIHVDDAAAAAGYLIGAARSGIYNGVDSEPASAATVMDWIAEHLQQPPLPRPEQPFAQGGRRVANARLLATGFCFRYPNFRSGYASLLSQTNH
jgi:nucleoside-diphosphate-sugar epimerase